MSKWGAIGAGAVTVLVMCGGRAIYLALQMSHRTGLLPFTATFAVLAMVGAVVLLWGRRLPIRDGREMPRFVKISFGVFIVVAVVSGVALVVVLPFFYRRSAKTRR